MQWDDSTHAGFARQGAQPWLPLAADYRARNVAAQDGDPASLLSLYRALAALRQAEPALNRGAIELIDVGVADVLAYRRTQEGSDSFLVLLNLGDESYTFNRNTFVAGGAEIVLSTDPARKIGAIAEVFSLVGDEGVIIRLSHRES